MYSFHIILNFYSFAYVIADKKKHTISITFNLIVKLIEQKYIYSYSHNIYIQQNFIKPM